MLKLAVVVLALASYCQALTTCDALGGGDQNDLPNWDFQTERPQSNGPLEPYNPVCDLAGEQLSVREAFEGDWSCIVTNNSPDDYVVRVQTTENNDDPTKDGSWDFYFFAPSGKQLLANSGKAGANEVCRLCGAKKVARNGQDWGAIKDLEQATYDFQCRRRCQAVLYQHRNFNGKSMTIASNIRDLTSFSLDNPPAVSSLKIFGEGCELRLWEEKEYKGVNGEKKEVCKFTATNPVSSWDMDAVRQTCCNKERCEHGQDCFQSVSIRDTKLCGGGNFGAGTKPAGCGAKGCVRPKRTDFTATATADRVVALERLFKAMAAVLEE